MQSGPEKLIRLVFKKWKDQHPKETQGHPDEETMACFLEGKLPEKEALLFKKHILQCLDCNQILTTCIKVKTEDAAVPQELLEPAKDLVKQQLKLYFLEIFLKAKEQALEILNTTGDVLVGQEFVPAPVLRSRQIKDFKDEVTIFKDFKDVRVEIKIENKAGEAFTVNVSVKIKNTHAVIKDLRIALLKDNLELESYLTDTGSVCFENMQAGKYEVEIYTVCDKLAAILLDIEK